MYFNSALACYFSNEELNATKSEKKNHLLKSSNSKDVLQHSFLLYVWNLSCYDSLKIKYAKLQAELSFPCAQRPFYSHSSKTSFWISLPTPKRGKPANNSKYNMRRQMLQKSVWREATMLRSAEVDAFLRPFWSLSPFGAKCHAKTIREKHPVFSASLLMAYGAYFISENNSIHFKQKDGQQQIQLHQLFLFFFLNQFLGTIPWRPVFSESSIMIGVGFTRKHLKRYLFPVRGAGLVTPTTTLNNW